MALRSIEELERLLLSMKLVTLEQLQEASYKLDHRQRTAEGLLSALENSHVLTSYQATKIREGEPGGLVLGEYKLMYRNASGSFARVFRACSVNDGRMVGLKLLRQKWAEMPEMVTAFHREAEMCKRLKHKNIVPIYEVGRQGTYHYFTMEFVEGGNLKDFATIRGKVAPAETTRYVLDIAEGLQYALGMGMTHRDLKLTNVLMSVHGVAKLVDFGLAGDDSISGSTRSGDGQQRALEYATLEKGTGAPDNDPRSDLYFLGTIYYELLSGQSPYPRTKDRDERKQLARYRNITPIRQHEPNIHRPVEKVIEKLLQINPYDRYQSAAELIHDLKGVLKYLGESNYEIKAVGNNSSEEKSDSTQTTILCVESRIQQQDQLRKHLGKRGYRVLVMGDLQRAVNRLQTNPPDCVLFMGPGFEDEEVANAFRQASRAANNLPLANFLLLSRKQAALESELNTDKKSRVLIQPITLPDLEAQINDVLANLTKY